jgi:hypothetical protein
MILKTYQNLGLGLKTNHLATLVSPKSLSSFCNFQFVQSMSTIAQESKISTQSGHPVFSLTSGCDKKGLEKIVLIVKRTDRRK